MTAAYFFATGRGLQSACTAARARAARTHKCPPQTRKVNVRQCDKYPPLFSDRLLCCVRGRSRRNYVCVHTTHKQQTLQVMSGIYLDVWDGSRDHPFNAVLEGTKGGWPHITVAYTGKLLSKAILKAHCKQLFDSWVCTKVTLQRARVNTFTIERTGETRHDVLLDLHDDDAKRVEATRDELRQAHPDLHEQFSMITPHVTKRICKTRDEADALAKELNDKWLPLTVKVIGISC